MIRPAELPLKKKSGILGCLRTYTRGILEKRRSGLFLDKRGVKGRGE